MEGFFCYIHEGMALKVGNDSRGEEVFYCDAGQHYLFSDGQIRSYVNIMPRDAKKGELEKTIVASD